MKPIATTFFLFFLWLVVSNTSFAQKPKKLEVEWLAKDVKSLQLISEVMPIENQTIETIKAVLGENTGTEEENLGFGAKRFILRKGNGYTSLQIDAFTLNGTIKYYEVSVGGDSDSWPQIRPYIVKAWRDNGGPDFEESKHGLAYRKILDIGFQTYRQVVAAELGEMTAVDIPAELRDYYDELISPLNNSAIGFGGCGYGGGVPQGRVAIDALVKANRIDLIENVLKGYNPGGRIYAVLALLEMKRRGFELSDNTESTITKISYLDIKVETCSGCIFTARTAKEILKEP